MQALDWDDLRIFAAVAERGSLRGASLLLGINHSTVFRRLNRLEKSIGARLFDRLPEGYALTGTGDELKTHALRVRDEVDSLQRRMQGMDFKPCGNIRITAPDNIAYTYLPGHLERFRQQYPEIHIELIVGGSSLDLTRREADVAIRATKRPPEHLVGRKVCSLAWAFYAARRYLREMGRPVNERDLENHRIIGGDGVTGRLPGLAWLEKHLANQIVARCNTLNAMSGLAAAGYGIALLPDDQQKSELVRLFPVTPAERTDLWILTHPELRNTERIRLLVGHLVTGLRSDERLKQVSTGT